MVSISIFAHEVFGAYWNLMILGAIKNNPKIEFPFDPQLIRYVAEKNELWIDLLQNSKEFCGYCDAIMEIPHAGNPWRKLSEQTSEYDNELLMCELLFDSGFKRFSEIDREIDFKDPESLSYYLQLGIERQSLLMFDALVVSRYFWGPKEKQAYPKFKQVVEQALSLVYTEPKENQFSKIFQSWHKRKYLVAIEDDEIWTEEYKEYKDWLISLVSDLTAATK